MATGSEAEEIEQIAREITIAWGDDPDEITWHDNGGIKEPFGPRWMYALPEARAILPLITSAHDKGAESMRERAAEIEPEHFDSGRDDFAVGYNSGFRSAVALYKHAIAALPLSPAAAKPHQPGERP